MPVSVFLFNFNKKCDRESQEEVFYWFNNQWINCKILL